MSIDIRPATLADEAAFLDLLEQLFDAPGAPAPGYTRERVEEAILENGKVEFLQKPFDSDQLLEAIRRLLDARDRGGGRSQKAGRIQRDRPGKYLLA